MAPAKRTFLWISSISPGPQSLTMMLSGDLIPQRHEQGPSFLPNPWVARLTAEKKNMQKESPRTPRVSPPLPCTPPPATTWWKSEVFWSKTETLGWNLFEIRISSEWRKCGRCLVLLFVQTYSISQLVQQVVPNLKCHQVPPWSDRRQTSPEPSRGPRCVTGPGPLAWELKFCERNVPHWEKCNDHYCLWQNSYLSSPLSPQMPTNFHLLKELAPLLIFHMIIIHFEENQHYQSSAFQNCRFRVPLLCNMVSGFSFVSQQFQDIS